MDNNIWHKIIILDSATGAIVDIVLPYLGARSAEAARRS